MNPLALLGWWKEILIALLVVAVGIQSYRLQGAQGERDILALEKTERARRDAMRDATNLRNKERTDEEYAAAGRRAAAVVVRNDGPGIVAPEVRPLGPAGSGDEPTICFSRERLADELAGWAQRDAARLTALSGRIGDRSSAVAREGEGVAAAYRACRAWALSLE